jgi:MGT family glycosyltransferase
VPQASIEALQDEDVSVVLTTGHQKLPAELLPLPANFRYTPFVPGLAMARRSDVLIHHGGYGSCQTGLFTGTPAVIVPTSSERESNARRVAALGAGQWVHVHGIGELQKHVDAGELRAKVKQVLADPSYKENAERISRRLQTYGGAVQAADLIEGSLGRAGR